MVVSNFTLDTVHGNEHEENENSRNLLCLQDYLRQASLLNILP